MNKVAFLTTEYAIKKIYDLSKTRVNLHNTEHIPDGSIIFVVNHFTRIETIFLPVNIQKITGVPVWSLADSGLFKGFVGEFISQAGAVSTHDPDRDKLMVRSLLTGEANWIIFPEGLMVKNKKLMHNGEFMVGTETGAKKPHTGAGTLALRTEFYRERLRYVSQHDPDELKKLLELFGIDSLDNILNRSTYIVPVNITYYPIRSRENILSRLAGSLMENPSERMIEEIMTEGTMILSGVDVDVRFDEAIKIRPYMQNPVIQWDINSKTPIRFDDPIASRDMLRNLARNIMHGYMTSIYTMTTVNHDHLFASILYRMPQERIDIDDLKRRVYLAATLDLCDEKCFKHKSMLESQVHLLTDDRYQKFDNFMAFAKDKGLLTIEEDRYLVKNTEAFQEETNFHTTRGDNPLIVMANEVEPLTVLQYNIQLLSQESPERIKEMVYEQLYQKTIRDFEKDYSEFYIDKESKPKEIGRPYLLEGEENSTGIVLIHGYMAAPQEVRGLADYLNRLGYSVFAPRLKGHGTSPDDLCERSYMEWIESVEEGAVMMVCRYESVVAGGFSTGAGLALDISSRLKGLKGVFAVSPPMKLKDYSAKFIPAVSVWNMLMDKFHIESAKKEFIENHPENPHINYTRNPIAGVRELERLMKDLEDRLAGITIPAFVLQSGIDPVVNVKGTRMIYELLGSQKKEYHLFHINRHGILLGEGAERVYKTIGEFLKTLNMI
ncbi:MAG: alpha/beta hydrolase [Proteobacteria bacterium]|nr:alpha/beta hydrolase [Pseudomonadota bacterium]